MTEDEAKTKWCPHVRVIEAGPNGHSHVRNRVSRVDANFEPIDTISDTLVGARCIGSACMAWRRQTVMIDRATGEPAVPGVAAIGALEERYSAHGYCGLAGQPA